MANLQASPDWADGIYQLEVTDPVMGGTPNIATLAGIDNIPHLQLASRTQWLRAGLLAVQNGAGYRDVITTAASQTLTAEDMGAAIIATGAATSTITLPALSAAPNGSAIEIINAGAGIVTIQRAGSDQIDLGHANATSVALAPGRNLRLIRPAGASAWHAAGAAGLDAAPAGQVAAFAMQAAPSGWLKANGALVSRTAYAALFAAIGTTFGAGDGSTTFALPDLRGEFLRGWDDGRGVDTGRVFGSAQAGSRLFLQTNNNGTIGATETEDAGTFTTTFTSQNINATTPSAQSVVFRPRNVAFNLCIKY